MNVVTPAATAPLKAAGMRESTLEVMVNCNLLKNGVNTSQSTSIMIVCTIFESDFGTVTGTDTCSLLSQRTSWVSPALIDIRTSKYESNKYVRVIFDATHPHSCPFVNRRHKPHLLPHPSSPLSVIFISKQKANRSV